MKHSTTNRVSPPLAGVSPEARISLQDCGVQRFGGILESVLGAPARPSEGADFLGARCG